MASLCEELVTSFNWRLELGLRRGLNHTVEDYDVPPPYEPYICPEWAKVAPALEEELPLHRITGNVVPTGAYKRRNILALGGYLYSV